MPSCGLKVDAAVGFQQHAVDALERTLADQARGIILCHQLWFAFARVAVAATTGGLEHQRLAGRNLLFAFALEPSTRGQREVASGAVESAEAAACGVLYPVDGTEQVEGLAFAAFDLDDLSEPAAKPAGAAGVGAQFAPAQQQRCGALGYFDLRAIDPARECGNR